MKYIFLTLFGVYLSGFLIKSIPDENIKLALMVLIILAFNIQCSAYLYKVTLGNKSRWTAIGFLGNIWAVLIHWYIFQ